MLDEIFGLGPVEEFLRDPMVSDVLVNGASKIYVERFGQLEKTRASFRDDAQLMLVLDGQAVGRTMAGGERVSIGLAPERARLARLPETQVFERFREAFGSVR